MQYHPEYFSMLFTLNISTEQRPVLLKSWKDTLAAIFVGSDEYSNMIPIAKKISSPEELQRALNYLLQTQLPERIESSVSSLQQDMYEAVIYPSPAQKNQDHIYRVGTFLKYFISQNDSRVYEDNLLFHFETYFYSPDINTTYERLQKASLPFMLLDLNAATIDKDAEKNLTRRYEHLISSMLHPNITLIDSDSICLYVAHDIYKKNGNVEEFIKIS